MTDWQDVLKPVQINSEQRKKILKGKQDSFTGKMMLYKIFDGAIPDSIWQVKHTQKLDMGDRTQQVVSQKHRNDTLTMFDNSTRNQNVRWKGAMSIFPTTILEKLLDFYTEEGEEVFDPFAGHNSRMEVTAKKNRNYTGWDCAKEFMEFNEGVKLELIKRGYTSEMNLVLDDSRNIEAKEKEDFYDFAFSSPPYWNIEWYGDEPEQLGNETYEEFMKSMEQIYKGCYKALKPGKFCIMNVNDFRKGGKYYAYHADTITALNNAGFKQYDTIIMKYQNAMRKSFPNQILQEKLMPKIHEFLLVFFKPPTYPHSAVYPFAPKK